MKYIISIYIFFSVCSGINSQIPVTSKLYVADSDKVPTQITHYSDWLLVIGYRENGKERFPFVQAMSFDGYIIWEQEYDRNAQFNDVIIHEKSAGVFIVGNTLPYDGKTNNESIIMRLDLSSGVPNFINHYDFDGRESMRHIIEHSNPVDSRFPFYISGDKNPASKAPSEEEFPFVLNMNINGDFKWIHEYEYELDPIELSKGMFEYNQDIMLVGNRPNVGNGIHCLIDGDSGLADDHVFTEDKYQFHHGAQIKEQVNGKDDFILVGKYVGRTDEAFVAIMDVQKPSEFLYGISIPELFELNEIIEISKGRFVAIGKWGKDIPVLLDISNTGSSLEVLSVSELSESLVENSKAYIDFYSNLGWINLTYGAFGFANGNGRKEFLISSFDHNLDNQCFRKDSVIFRDISIYPLLEKSVTRRIRNVNSLRGGVFTSIVSECKDLCISNACAADFSYQSTSCNVQFKNISQGISPIEYQWDIGCDGIIDYTLENPTHPFSCLFSEEVCLTIKDATGCSSTSLQKVTSRDSIPPQIVCPPDTVLVALKGECSFDFNAVPVITDNCDPMPTWICQLTGATTGGQLNVDYNVGVTKIKCVVMDCSGNTDSCTYTITIQDEELPEINCPPAATLTRPACIPEPVLFADPTATDNCEIEFVGCRVPQDNLFDCGVTQVVCTATDINGNRNQCTFPVEVICLCGDILETEIICTDINAWEYIIYIENRSGADTDACQVVVNTPQSDIIVSSDVSWDQNTGEITGSILSTNNVPNPFILNVTLSCDCELTKPASCSFSVPLVPPCCDSVWVDDISICSTDELAIIPINTLGTFDDVLEVTWYISDAPCSAPNWIPFQTTSGLMDLIIYPEYHTGDLCFFASIIRGEGSGGCMVMTTNVGAINLCEPVICNVESQELCFIDVAVIPAPFIFTPEDEAEECILSYQWYQDVNGQKVIIPGEISEIYQPPGLSYDASVAQDSCFQIFTYYLDIESICGISTCQANIKLYDNNAPDGNIYMFPLEDQPFCPGEDASLFYNRACSGEPEMWSWFVSNDGVNWSGTENGLQSEKYNTNQLFQDTWFTVVDQNGVCPEDSQNYYIEIVNEITIEKFTAQLNHACEPTEIALSLDIDIDPNLASFGCQYIVEWYKGYELIQTTKTNNFPIQEILNLDQYDGNYYVEIYNSCCPSHRVSSDIVTIDPLIEVVLTRPCYRCTSQEVKIEAIINNVPSGQNCTYRWEHNGVEIIGENDSLLEYPASGQFTFHLSCGPCELTREFYVYQCGEDTTSAIDLIQLEQISVRPNPSNGHFTITRKVLDQYLQVNIKNMMGVSVHKTQLFPGQRSIDIIEKSWKPGIYFVEFMDDKFNKGVLKIVMTKN